MIIQEINRNWKMRECGGETYLDAVVPGSVYHDLLLHDRMEDPYYRDNELKALKLMEKDYEYTTYFACSEDMLGSEEIKLCFEGLDTIADIYLNGIHIGYADNMHRVWEYAVKEHIKKENNTLRIVFHSPTKYIKEQEEKEHWPGVQEAMKGTSHIRKSQCMFGWDWGPRLPDAGIFRKVELKGIQHARIDSVYIWQEHKVESVTLKLDVDVECVKFAFPQRFGEQDSYLNEQDYHYQVTLFNPQGEIICQRRDERSVEIQEPQLWWPRGMGEQPLYTVVVTLYHGEEECDVWTKRIGLRTLTIRREKDEYGESFAHEANGITFFAMGADYIPEDSILSRVTAKRTRNLLEQAAAANFNSIRVWGGGYYPDDFFWDACDELGLVVWMDFAFACAVYMLPEEFERNITVEFIQNVKRIRNHASLGLWCGNNEIESFMHHNESFADERYHADYIKLYEYVLPKMIREYDPQTFYWPSSPSTEGGFMDPDNPNRGDVHYWDVWHGNKPFTEYRKFFFRYLSEFGFQSFPSIRTVESFTESEDRNIFSYVMEKHQRNAAANGKIMNYMEQTYLYPNSFDTLIYASQLLQADAIRYGVEHFRRNRGRCMGTIIWQLNDCWPVASWSSIDYYGRWKALHYYAKRFFAPLLLSCQEESILTQDANPNAEEYELQKSIHLCVTNDFMEEAEVTVSFAVRNSDAEILRGESKTVKIAARSCTWLPQVEMPELKERGEYVSYEMKQGTEIIGSGTVLFTVPKFFFFKNPNLAVRVEGDELVVTADAFAKSVEIRNANDDFILSDNFFDINGGERRVKILKGEPEGIEVRSVYDIR